MVDLFKRHTSRPIFPATEPLSLGQLRNGGSGYHFQGTFDNKTILIKTILATNFLRIYNRTRQWYETQNQVPTLRTAGDEEPIDLDPEQLSLITQKQRNNATSSRRLAATTHRKSRDADSESFRTGSIWQNGGKWTTLHYHWIRHGWKQLYSFYAENTQVSKDFSKVKITSISWQSRQERARDRNRSSRICWNFGHRSASTVTTTRKFEVLGAYIARNWTARTTIYLFYRNWTPKILEPCFRRSRRAAGEHRRKVNTRFGQEAAPKPKLILIGCSQRDWKITWSRAQHKRDCGFVNISKHFTKILRHGGFHEADGAVRWTPVLTLMEDAEQTPNWNKKDWIDALSRSTDKSKYGVWWGPKTERVSIRVQYTAIVTGFKINSNLVSLKQIPLKLEGTHIPHGQLFQVQINPREWFVGRKIESKKHETSFFLLTSESARIVIETANDRVDRTRWWTKNGTVQAH